MKLFFLLSFFTVSANVFAQPKLITQATITTSTNIIAPEDEDVSQIQNQGGGGFNMRNFMDGEIKSTTFIKDNMVKTNFKSEAFRGSIYRDNAAKLTTTIFELMGNKQGFVASDDEQAEMMKKADSIRKERAKTDTSVQQRRPRRDTAASVVAYTEETKKIAGYTCKKAYIITDRLMGKDTMEVWYTPELKFPNVASSGGTSSLGNMGGNTGFDKVAGFIMAYNRDMPRGRKMEVKVTKIEIADVSDKEFEIPKDVEIKTMKEMNEQGGGMFRMMMQRP